MKRVIAYLLLAVIGLTAFSQSPSKSVSMRPAYPVAIGEKTVDSVTYSNNGLYMHDILQDSLPRYEIGEIPKQTVRYTEEGHGFYVKADSLHSANVNYSYSIDIAPIGPIEFNNKTGRFKFYPAANDYQTFVVNFVASSGTNSVSEDVEFSLMPPTIDESAIIQSQGTMPSAEDYTLVAESELGDSVLNGRERKVYSYSVSGKDVVFDNSVQNKVWGLSGREDIHDLNIYAERLFVRSALSFPQTNVTIFAKELIFVDKNGVVSGINTTPIPVDTITNGTGINGANAGNISLYVKTLRGNCAKRFILNGGKGQSSNRNGTPGNGGNGGTIISTIDVSQYCDYARGSSGLKYAANHEETTQVGEIIGAGVIGSPGHYEAENNPYLYLHPYYIAPVIRHANDAFINNKPDAALQVCNEYHALIEDYMNSTEWESCDEENDISYQQDLSEIDDMLIRLNQGLDYFGNPQGWVPLLSFEVMLSNYNAEIDRSIPTLYMYYWLTKVDQTLQNKVKASQFAANNTEQEIDNNLSLINQWIAEIPVLEDQSNEIQDAIDNLTQKIQVLENELLAKARKNVKKRNRIKKAMGVCKVVANCLPVLGPVGTAVGTAMNVVLSSGILDQFTGVNYSQAVQGVSNQACSENFFSNLSNALKSAKDSIGANGLINGLKSSFKGLKDITAPLISNITSVSSLLSHGSMPEGEVKSELERLKAQSVEFQRLDNEINTLNSAKAVLKAKIDKMMCDINGLNKELGEDLVSLDAFRRDAFCGNSKRDLNAMIYLEKMEQRAKNRLLKYHYYLRKAYEYRMLRPYVGEFNLVGMFERFEALGMALDDVIDANAYSSLSAIFRDVVSGMAEEIIDQYSNSYPEQSAPITIVLSKEQLNLINTSDGIKLNFHEMGIFSPDEENVRIVDLGIKHIDSHVEGNVGYSGYMDLNMTHSGVSQFRKDGQIYWFNHISKSTSSPHTWGFRHDAVTQENTTITPSAASESLLYSILNGSNNNIMLFSRPSAWADVNLTKKVHTQGGADIVIDSLVLTLQYDFTRRPNRMRNIDITTSGGMMPYIACNQADYNGRSDGEGNLYRSYINSSAPVTFTATEKYENYYFINWTDRAGTVVSDTKELTVNRNRDQFYTANYERRVPIMNVPDTIKVAKGAGRLTVQVSNIGSGETPMEWEVSDSLCSWVHIDGVAEGIDTGSFSFKYDANMGETERVDVLEFFAPETDEMSKMIYVIQSGNAGVYGDVNGDGIVSTVDVTIIYNYLLNSDTTYLSTSDVNGDGIISSVDITIIYNILLGNH